MTFGVDADKLKLWKVEIPGDRADLLSSYGISTNSVVALHHLTLSLTLQVDSEYRACDPQLPQRTHKTPALENDRAVMLNDSGIFSPRNDQCLHDMLHILISKNNLKFTVFIETLPKPFSDWSFLKVCQLHGSDDPSLSVFPPFTCEYKELEEDSSKAILKQLS
ncbi:hypothetical protein RhiirC2_784771 [Rhizophagus irregularis]|uniref:Crinkler family protein n=1 Tax=Rhizophagus irregularis TaxID=588596 RepID=A0A2N1MXR4_9GLOM|nr:hypothetical protein RhiirC2_784771 [Rhizophagus irregularis]